MKEVFKDIPNYEGLYQVSDLGNVRSLDRLIGLNGSKKYLKKGILLKFNFNKGGYAMVSLYKKGVRKYIGVHQLVAMAFLNHKPNRYELIVDHINNIQSDNKLENLQIITTRKNNSKDKKGYTSKYVGVYYRLDRNKFYANIKINGKSKYIGSFNFEYDAHLAYQEELNKLNATVVNSSTV